MPIYERPKPKQTVMRRPVWAVTMMQALQQEGPSRAEKEQGAPQSGLQETDTHSGAGDPIGAAPEDERARGQA